MMQRSTFLISALCLLILANVLMMSYASPAFTARGEGFVGFMEKYKANKNAGFTSGPSPGPHHRKYNYTHEQAKKIHDKRAAHGPSHGPAHKETFTNYSGNPGGSRDTYQAIGAFDGIKLQTGNNISSWRYTSPNEPLQGNFPKFEPGPDNLFMFKDNQCKPECCGASFSCNGGCVCTTPEQRDYINMRGGNRTSPESGV